MPVKTPSGTRSFDTASCKRRDPGQCSSVCELLCHAAQINGCFCLFCRRYLGEKGCARRPEGRQNFPGRHCPRRATIETVLTRSSRGREEKFATLSPGRSAAAAAGPIFTCLHQACQSRIRECKPSRPSTRDGVWHWRASFLSFRLTSLLHYVDELPKRHVDIFVPFFVFEKFANLHCFPFFLVAI